MSDDKQEIISFGKHKGKPIDILRQDESYTKWLLAQDWFPEKYNKIYSIVVNNFNTQPTDTPEHNEIQIKFLSEDFRLKLAYHLNQKTLFQYNQQHLNEHLKALADSLLKEEKAHSFFIKEAITYLNRKKFLRVSDVEFERKGVDVFFSVDYGYGHIGVSNYTIYGAKQCIEKLWKFNFYKEFRVEIKPTIGDDFPSVLRQVKNNGSNIILFKEYNGVGASYDEFVRFFSSQNKTVVKMSDVVAVQIPQYDEIISTDVLTPSK